VLTDNSHASSLGGPTGVDWLVKLPAGASAADVASAIDVFLAQGVTSATPPSGLPVFQALTRSAAGRPSDTQTGSIFILGGLALVEAALIASAAFAVSIRRRQRELGLLGAVGAEPSHLATTVLAEATLLGVLGAVLGILVGAAAALATGPRLDGLVDRRNPPIAISPPWLLAAGGIGVLAALIAAALPAWTASRVPILAALSGRRPPTAPARRTLRLGLATIVIAFLITLLGTAVAFRSADGSPGLGIGLLLLGAVLGVLGFGACSPWLLERLEGLAARLPLSPRLALRDTARHRSRNGPIVTALLASFAATVAVAAIFSSQQASVAQFYQPSVRDDQLVMNGPGALTAGPQAASDLGAVGAAPLVPATTSDDAGAFVDAPGWESHSDLVIGDENLMRALGAGSAIPDLRTGSVILFSAHAADIQQALIRSGSGPREGTLPARVVATGQTYAMLPGAVVSADAAASLGLRPGIAGMFVMRLPHAVTQADIDDASLLAAKSADTAVNWETGIQRPGDAFRLILVIASLLFALTITGVAVALGEAEARPDQRTLLAIGADPRIRRRITAARAGVLAAIAGVLAVPAGLLPVWGLLATRHVPLVVPLPEVLVAMAVLPVAAVVGAALLSRPISTWSAYRGEGG
jgi:putative ABC transport system permease protein